MKFCPRCNQTYADENVNFCLNDGELLTKLGDDAPPTIFMDPPRVTDQTPWQQQTQYQPPAPWQSEPWSVQNQSYGVQAMRSSPDQTLPTVSLVLGIASFLMVCCYGGIWLGVPAAIIGFLAMRNIDGDPARYGGRGLAIGGLVLGIISLLSSILFIIIAIIAK